MKTKYKQNTKKHLPRLELRISGWLVRRLRPLGQTVRAYEKGKYIVIDDGHEGLKNQTLKGLYLEDLGLRGQRHTK